MMKKSDLKSFHEDKAVQDNIVESWLCVDCGVNTLPGFASGPELRLAYAMGADSVTAYFDNNAEVYSVKDAIWEQADMRAWNGCLCIGCLEQRLGRRLTPNDFPASDGGFNRPDMPCTDRLRDRRGGPQ